MPGIVRVILDLSDKLWFAAPALDTSIFVVAVMECCGGSGKSLLEEVDHLWGKNRLTGPSLTILRSILRRTEGICHTKIQRSLQAGSARLPFLKFLIGTWKASLKVVILVFCTTGYATLRHVLLQGKSQPLPRSLQILRRTLFTATMKR